ncbi:cytokine-like protein 1 [Chanos chanos]|uniref:Cytokine-like protein 1 n=1 Tax=Chanos chanos TaxID=29144 RepID=A0A6J2X002_CHACN|nr:cytokine-like protein 1 [Chanos chanos]
MLRNTLCFLTLVPLVWGQPYPIPPTCYTKVLTMGKEISQRVVEMKTSHDTRSCTHHMPYLNIDVHNACVMHTMNSYMSMLDGLRQRRCGYSRRVQALRGMIRQLYIIMSQRCHGELVFTVDNCAALERRPMGG